MRVCWSGRLAVLSGVVLTMGCASAEKELGSVARDWCLSIRASQVIPVYPLTEDLQPGDVFLVTTPIQDQVKLYRKKGFLPLDQSVTRLPSLQKDYESYYASSYWTNDYGQGLPHSRNRLADGEDGSSAIVRDEGVAAPLAAFPSYAFEVRSGSGLKLAVPVQGVPVGLGMMKTDSATGSITISDAYTYGLPGDLLLRRLHEWAGQPDVLGGLSELASTTRETLMLRVVGRVYLTGAVVVSLSNQAASSGGLDVGDSKEVELLEASTQDSVARFSQARTALNEALNDSLPGGSVRIAQASQRSVTMTEEFERPLVIGYLGFDVPVLKSGRLGTPVATLSMLEQREGANLSVAAITGAQRQVELRISELHLRLLDPSNEGTGEERRVVEVLALAAQGLPSDSFGKFRERAATALSENADGSVSDAMDLVTRFELAAQTYVAEADYVTEIKEHEARGNRVVQVLEHATDRIEAKEE